MPRPNSERSIQVEDFLARRIEELRAERKWTYRDLAKEMGDVGCAIEPSAIQKIEKGAPRRRIVVNELVGFAAVFGVEIPDLLVSPDYLRDVQFHRDLQEGMDITHEIAQLELRRLDVSWRLVDLCLDPEDGDSFEEVIRVEAREIGDSAKSEYLNHLILDVERKRKDPDHG